MKIRYALLFFIALIVVACEPAVTVEYAFDDTLPAVSQAAVAIDAVDARQLIRGFGAANIIGWRPDLTAADRVTAFSVADGIGLSVLRVRVSPDAADWAANAATINAARANGATVIASAWTAPASMKDNGGLVGGKLKSDSYAAYAAHLSAFNTAVGGVDALSPINEPNITVSYESMLMNASEVGAFVAAEGSNCGAPIMAPEPFNMSQTYINTYLGTAAANTTYVAGHIYGASPASFNTGGKEIWMTEHYIDSATSGNNWVKSLAVGKEIHDCLQAGYGMYVWWYVKRYYGPIDEDGSVTKTGRVMSQFARFVRPGAFRVAATANPLPNVHVTAYAAAGKVIVVVVNRDPYAHKLTLNFTGAALSALTPHITSYTRNCLQDADVPVSGGSAIVPIYAGSVTTFVSD